MLLISRQMPSQPATVDERILQQRLSQIKARAAPRSTSRAIESGTVPGDHAFDDHLMELAISFCNSTGERCGLSSPWRKRPTGVYVVLLQVVGDASTGGWNFSTVLVRSRSGTSTVEFHQRAVGSGERSHRRLPSAGRQTRPRFPCVGPAECCPFWEPTASGSTRARRCCDDVGRNCQSHGLLFSGWFNLAANASVVFVFPGTQPPSATRSHCPRSQHHRHRGNLSRAPVNNLQSPSPDLAPGTDYRRLAREPISHHACGTLGSRAVRASPHSQRSGLCPMPSMCAARRRIQHDAGSTAASPPEQRLAQVFQGCIGVIVMSLEQTD